MAGSDDHNDNRYTLNLSHRQVRVLILALDMYTRISIAQLDRILDHPSAEISRETRELVRGLFDEVKHLMYGLAPNEHKSICDPKLPEDVHIGYEIEKVLQKIIAEVEDHHRWSVWRDGPLKVSTEPLPTIERVEDDG